MPVTPFPAGPDIHLASVNDLPVEGSEDHLAFEFSTRHSNTLRYVALWGRWLQWQGTRWKFEDTLAVFDLARLVAREFATLKDDAKLGKAAIVAAIERFARADRRHARTVGIWDAHSSLINGPIGIIDLCSGAMLPHDPSLYMTKIMSVSPGGDCPRWLEFLARVTAGDGDLQAYLQRVAGYCLTGETIEHALFFLYGTGGNGKGVFLNTLRAIWDDYATVAPMETFVETIGDRHPTDLAMLRGARLVIAQETEKGRHWAEAKISQMTGGDPITARFMRQDFFTYQPAFKLMIAGNHKPSLKSVNEAIRRRLHMIPFTVTIPPAERDLHLFEALKPEWPGILQWALDGCLEWRRIGLAPPAAVLSATEEYLAAEDAFARWIEDCCITGRAHWGVGERLWRSWKAWAEGSNEKPGSRKGFADTMAAHGHKASKSQHVRGYDGIDLAQRDRFDERADLR
jgi:P4 family phage/plasmid primase-like protien